MFYLWVLFELSLESSFWRICSEEHKSAALTSSTENVGKPWIALSSIHFCNVILSNFGANIIKKILALYCFRLKSLCFIEFYFQIHNFIEFGSKIHAYNSKYEIWLLSKRKRSQLFCLIAQPFGLVYTHIKYL